jgi:hypothetical protein
MISAYHLISSLTLFALETSILIPCSLLPNTRQTPIGIYVSILLLLYHLLYPLPLLNHSHVPLLLQLLYEHNGLLPLGYLLLHDPPPVLTVVFPVLYVVLVDCMLHPVYFFAGHCSLSYAFLGLVVGPSNLKRVFLRLILLSALFSLDLYELRLQQSQAILKVLSDTRLS